MLAWANLHRLQILWQMAQRGRKRSRAAGDGQVAYGQQG